jgi:sugar phosphate isomerase/epimerase
MMHWRPARDQRASTRFTDALTFLDYAHQIGAGGVQVSLGSTDANYAAQLRAKAESHGMYYEGQASLPQNEADVARFEAEVRLAKAAGAGVIRTALLSGRRYETFDSADAFRRFADRSWQSLTLAAPVARRHGMRLAIENHKDWHAAELVGLLKRLGSEHVGVCVDTGNNLALLEDPLEVVSTLAPLAFSTHIKDMAVEPCNDGFLLSEVPLGEGFLDLKRMVEVLEKANPSLQFSLEMITRDPLRIPCLTDKYWATMPGLPAKRLAAALELVRQKSTNKPLPRVSGLSAQEQLDLEDANVRACLAFARTKLGL